MTTTGRSTVVGVFTEPGEVDVAIEELQSAGFKNDQIKFIEHEGVQRNTSSPRNLIGAIQRVFSRKEAKGGSIVDDLVSMGVPEEEARYYQSEFEAGRSIIAVQADGRQEEAREILLTNGASDINTRPTT